MTLFERFRNPNLHFLAHPHPHSPDKPILKVEGLSVEYESGMALDNLGFELQRGERLAVVGPNGAGKSTLFKVIAGVLRPIRGLGKWPDTNLAGISLAYVPQRNQGLELPLPPCDVVIWARRKRALVRSRATRLERSNQALAAVRLTDLATGRSTIFRDVSSSACSSPGRWRRRRIDPVDEPLPGRLEARARKNCSACSDCCRPRMCQ